MATGIAECPVIPVHSVDGQGSSTDSQSTGSRNGTMGVDEALLKVTENARMALETEEKDGMQVPAVVVQAGIVEQAGST